MAKKNKPDNSFTSEDVMFLHCSPGDNGDEPISIVAVAGRRTGTITHIMLTLPDTRKLIMRLLASLDSVDDPVATSLLECRFPTDHDGHYRWPDEDEGFGVF